MNKIKTLLLILALTLALTLASCGGEVACTKHIDEDVNGLCDSCGANVPLPCETHVDPDMNAICDACNATIEYITIARALELCGEAGNITADRYYILATVDSVTNQTYGAMNISDETGTISVYGTYSADGSNNFSLISPAPRKGDTVSLHCILQNYNGTKEVKNARLVGFTDNSKSFDTSKYTNATIKEAREAADGSFVIVEGVVARVTYSTGKHPAGVILVDGTQSIYVYDADLASSAKIGNKVKIAAEKDYWILEDEQENAAKYGYIGCNQLTDAHILSNDGGNNKFDTSWIPESTVMDVLETPFSEDITTSIYKVTALVVKADMPGFVNYYINDLDGETGTYVYTQCNGGDFEWLDEFDGKICTVYLTALNAKSTATGCVFRFLPVSVEAIENFSFPDADVPAHVLKYYAMKQLSANYSGDPALELITSVTSELLGFEGVSVSYSSSNEEVVSFTKSGEVVTMNCPGVGTATVTVTASYKGVTATETVEIKVTAPAVTDYITVAEAIAAAKDTEVTVKGIVGASLVNKVGFYLIDESGVIAIMLSTDAFKGIAIGDEVILKGKRTTNDDGTQQYIADAEILTNFYGNNELPADSYTVAKISELFASSDTTKVFVTKGVITKDKQAYYTNYYIADPEYPTKSVQIYASGEKGLTWLDEYLGEEITLELIMCNWNGKAYKIAVISVVTPDGKVINSNNFDQYGK